MPQTTIPLPVRSIELDTAQLMADTVRCLVSEPDLVCVTTRTHGDIVSLIVRVNTEDIGKVIGKQGRTARALRILLNAISDKTGIHFELDIQVG